MEFFFGLGKWGIEGLKKAGKGKEAWGLMEGGGGGGGGMEGKGREAYIDVEICCGDEEGVRRLKGHDFIDCFGFLS